MWDTTQELPLVPMDSFLGVDVSVALLMVDYSGFHGPSSSYSVEDVWDGENVNSDNVSTWWPLNFKALPPILG